MSAYIVSDKLISAILGAYAKSGRGYISEDDAQVMGQILLDANYTSVNYRYRENNEAIFELDTKVFDVFHDMVKAMRLCDTLDYQSCEFPQWEKSEACSLLKKIRYAVSCKVPGYSQARWSFDDELM